MKWKIKTYAIEKHSTLGRISDLIIFETIRSETAPCLQTITSLKYPLSEHVFYGRPLSWIWLKILMIWAKA